MAEQNPATRVIERDAVLQPNVKAVVGEQVDGRGSIDAAVVRSAIRDVAGNLSRCYDRMVDRGALARGRITLAFTVHENRRVSGIRTEQTASTTPPSPAASGPTAATSAPAAALPAARPPSATRCSSRLVEPVGGHHAHS